MPRQYTKAEKLMFWNFEKNDAFYIVTERGPRLILAGKYADELRNDERVSHADSLMLV